MSDFELGLDFGTSTTLVAIPGLEPRVFPIGKESGNSWIPSVVALSSGDKWLLGEDADSGAIAEQFRSPKSAITNNLKTLTNGNGETIDADDAIKRILKEVVSRCTENGLPNFSHVRLSCPAMWTGDQRKRLVRLVNESGLIADIDHVIDEPISASIAWWWSMFAKNISISEQKRALVFDLGGGTLDVAVVNIYPRPGMPELTILSARGIAVAGDELDRAFAAHIISRLEEEKGYKLTDQPDSNIIQIAIRLAARECKEILSSLEETDFRVDSRIASVPSITVSRLELNDVYAPQMKLALNCVDAALREARMKASDNLSGHEIARIPVSDLGAEIDYIVLAGGMSQIKKVAEDLQTLMPNASVEFATGSARNSTNAIVLGTANQNEFADLNIHRPNFDFAISYTDRFGKEYRDILYEAFTPLYDPYQVASGVTDLGIDLRWKPVVDPLGGRVFIGIETIGGQRVSLFDVTKKIGATGIELEADHFVGISMKMYVNGKIIIKDRSGVNVVLRVREWPHIRWRSSIDSAKFALRLEVETEGVSVSVHHDAWRYK